MNKFYPVDTTKVLQNMLKLFSANNSPQEVSFRDLVSWVKMGERSTHHIHSYPGKLLPQIAHFFLAAVDWLPAKCKVLDPFSGTGTVALEVMLSGKESYYSELNPLARLITKVKTTAIASEALIEASEMLYLRYDLNKKNTFFPPNVTNIEHWFSKENVNEICIVLDCIEKESDANVKDFFKITLSSILKKVSNADERLSVPVLSKVIKAKQSVFNLFKAQVDLNISRMAFWEECLNMQDLVTSCVGFDARGIKQPGTWNYELDSKIDDNCFDLTITSPPYMSAQKYIRASSFNLEWLGLASRKDMQELEIKNIGKERFNRQNFPLSNRTKSKQANEVIAKIEKDNILRASIAGSYINDMTDVIAELHRVTKVNGHFVMVIGNNSVCGLEFRSSDFLSDIAQQIGFKLELELVDNIKSRGLMTRRNKTAGIITQEHILVFRRL
ncbi:MAG: hypothetical protein JHD28_09760 [Bacteroidia bacterium]|nr:hypothetical protein [Bacteroidia bacterium]